MTNVTTPTATSAPDIGPQVSRRPSMPEGWGTPILLALAWSALIVVSVLNRGDFWSRQTLLAITFTMSVAGVLAVGLALVAISGGILDISIGAAMIMSAYVGVLALQAGWPDFSAALLMLAVGALWGTMNASIIVFGRVNPIVVTLATMFTGTAVMFLLFHTAQPPSSSWLRGWGPGTTLGLPNIFWPMALLIALVGFFLPRTRAGRRAIAVGGNAQAAKTRGISLRKTRYAIFIAAGVCAGLAAMLLVASHASFNPDTGSTFLLPVVSAVILGGITLSGGRGKIWTLFLSVGFLSTVPTALVFFGMSAHWQMVFSGSILIVAVALDGYREKKRTAS